jgi:hypothetical protein
MLTATMQRAILLLALVSAALAAGDPFPGKWKLSFAKSKLTGQTIEIDEVFAEHWRFKEDERTDAIFADGPIAPLILASRRVDARTTAI